MNTILSIIVLSAIVFGFIKLYHIYVSPTQNSYDDIYFNNVCNSVQTDVSFISEKNKSVSNVQFVIKTDAVVKPIAETPKPEKKKKLSFWQKFINLFK